MATVSVRYIVDDVAAAIGFYCDRLAFTEVLHPASTFAMLSRGDFRLVLSAPEAARVAVRRCPTERSAVGRSLPSTHPAIQSSSSSPPTRIPSSELASSASEGTSIGAPRSSRIWLLVEEAPGAANNRLGAAQITPIWQEVQPAREMKPPTTVPYPTWATTLTSGVWGP